MYTPRHFEETDRQAIAALVRAHPFATLITHNANGLLASHLPMIFEPDAGEHGTLLGHLARPNPQWQDAGSDGDALAIFTGPNAYVTPSWYPTKSETGKVVPTWNYATVHCHGRLSTFEDRDALRAFVSRLTDLHESPREQPWSVDDAPGSYIDGQLGGIVGVRLEVSRIEAKWKMNQNKPDGDRRAVMDAFGNEPGETARAIAEEMRRWDRTKR